MHQSLIHLAHYSWSFNNLCIYSKIEIANTWSSIYGTHGTFAELVLTNAFGGANVCNGPSIYGTHGTFAELVSNTTPIFLPKQGFLS